MKDLQIIDTHAHLEEIPDLEQTLEKAQSAGVIAIIGMGSGLSSNRKILKISQDFPGYIFPALGIHPAELKEENLEETLSFIADHIVSCIAIGEVGLDYKYDIDKKLQKDTFMRILTLAKEFNKPVSIHSRFAWEDCLSLAKQVGINKAIFHWYSGPEETLQEILSYGYLISVTPAVTYSQPSRKAVAITPLDNLLLETDSPVPYRGKPSTPSSILVSLQGVAEIKGMPEEEVAERTTWNAKKMFQIS